MSSNVRNATDALVVGLLVVVVAVAQSGGPYDVTWNTIDGGGVMWSEGGDFVGAGTMGQSDAGRAMAGGDFELTGGFWPGVLLYHVGDFDGNGIVTLADYAELSFCVSGPGGSPPPECQFADLDWDGHVDLRDFAVFQQAFADLP
jgi:hypothetical protein